MNRHAVDDITWVTFENLGGLPDLVHAVSTRSGGVSLPPFQSLNLGFHVGDDATAVLENRRRFARSVGFRLEDVVATSQVHGTALHAVTRRDVGRGATWPAEESWVCDALVTGAGRVFLMGFSADCPLVVLADAEAHVVGLAHAGWRGVFSDILRKTVAAMTELGAEPSRTFAGISPAIGPCCYEVGGELRDALPADVADPDRFFRPHGEKFLLDLPLFCRERLIDAGVRDERIESAGVCSRCDERDFFSHRGSRGRTGRHAAVVGWKR